MEFGEDIDEVGLPSHDGADVFVGSRSLVEAAAKELDAATPECLIALFGSDTLERIATGHATAGTV